MQRNDGMVIIAVRTQSNFEGHSGPFTLEMCREIWRR